MNKTNSKEKSGQKSLLSPFNIVRNNLNELESEGKEEDESSSENEIELGGESSGPDDEEDCETHLENENTKFSEKIVAFDDGERIGQTICPFCKKECEIMMDKEASLLTYLGSLAAFVFFGFYCIFILPLLIQASKTLVHRCSLCGEILEQKDLFSMPSLGDPIFTFRFGNCAFIISRKYSMIIVIIFSLIFLWEYFNSPPKPQPEATSKFLNGVKWEAYVEDCGSLTFMKNGLRAKQNFEKHYFDKKVKWTGIFLDSRETADKRFSQYSKILFIKMDPSDSKGDFPDITMLVPRDVFERYKEIISSLDEYDEILFTASFNSLGDEYSLHLMKLLHIEKTGNKISLENIKYIEFKQAGNLRKNAG